MSDRITTKAGVFESGDKDAMGVQYKDGRLIACHNPKLTDYAVADGTEVICDRAFMNMKELRSVKLPDSLKAIGDSAFSGCKALADITIPDGVTEIRQSTFRDCDALAAIELPASVTEIEKFAFGRGLTTLVVNAPEMKIDRYAFMNARDFSTLIVPAGTTDYYRALLDDMRVKADVEEIEEPNYISEPYSTSGAGVKYDTFDCDAASASLMDTSVENLKSNGNNNMKENEAQCMQENVNTKTITLRLWGEGQRIDVLDSVEEVIDCINSLTTEDLFEITVIDGDSEMIVSKDELGESLGMQDEDDEDYDESFNWDAGYLEDPEESYEDAEIINSIQTKVYGDVEIEIPENETLDLRKVRLMWTEMVLPDSEVPVYCGVLYDGKQYPIILDIDSEREISVEEIWCR